MFIYIYIHTYCVSIYIYIYLHIYIILRCRRVFFKGKDLGTHLDSDEKMMGEKVYPWPMALEGLGCFRNGPTKPWFFTYFSDGISHPQKTNKCRKKWSWYPIPLWFLGGVEKNRGIGFRPLRPFQKCITMYHWIIKLLFWISICSPGQNHSRLRCLWHAALSREAQWDVWYTAKTSGFGRAVSKVSRCSKAVLFNCDLPSGNLTWLLKMAIEIVDLPMKNGDFPQLCDSLPEGKPVSLGFSAMARSPFRCWQGGKLPHFPLKPQPGAGDPLTPEGLVSALIVHIRRNLVVQPAYVCCLVFFTFFSNDTLQHLLYFASNEQTETPIGTIPGLSKVQSRWIHQHHPDQTSPNDGIILW